MNLGNVGVNAGIDAIRNSSNDVVDLGPKDDVMLSQKLFIFCINRFFIPIVQTISSSHFNGSRAFVGVLLSKSDSTPSR
jgi:hypothetical protein